MTLFQSIILGIVQGASEFLPISSSGHLVLTPLLFGWEIPPQEAFIFDVLVQVATLAAVIIYFWQDLISILRSFLLGIKTRQPFKEQQSLMGWLLILATIPAGVLAVLFKDTFEKAFSDPKSAAIFLLCTSVFLVVGELFGNRSRDLKSTSWLDAIIIGIFQVFALFPGVSRSGSTISGGLIRGFNRESAARFSFLMAVPVMSAAGLLALFDLFQSPDLLSSLPIYFAGFLTAAIVGYLAIRWFISYLSKQSLYLFAAYCAIVGSVFLVFLIP